MNKRLNELEACIKYFKILKSKKVASIKITRKHKPKEESSVLYDISADYYFGLSKTDWLEQPRNSPERMYLRKRGFTASTLNKCKAKINYSASYPIIFPMFDMGEFRGWVCRTMNKLVEAKRKYLYNEGFGRSNTLVGTYNAETVVLVEGYMDWLKMKQFGIKNVAAILGWKITEQQVQKLKLNGVKTIISALDSDSCGTNGTKYLKKFFKVIKLKFPAGIKDPGELNKKDFRRIQNEFNRRFEKSGEKIRLQ